MGKTIVVSTSTSCLDYYDHGYNIPLIRIKMEIGGKLYADGTDMPADRFYKMLEDDPSLVPQTTQVSTGELIEFFEGLYAQGYDQVFVTTISGKLSGSINGVLAAAAELEDKMRIVAYDTKTVCFNEGCFALEACRMLDAGATFEEVTEKLDQMAANNLIIFAVEHLDFLIKNGRLSNASGFAANLLNIKPLLEVQSSGEILAVKKVRSIQGALREVANRAKEYIAGRDYFMYIVASTNYRVPYLREQLNLTTGDGDDLFIVPCSPIVGCHVGNGALGVGIFVKE